MHKFKRKFLIGLFLLFLTIAPANANDNFIPIRVGISNTSFNTYLFEEIEFINFFNGNAVVDGSIDYTTVDIDKEFITPMTGITIEFNDFKANKVVVCFDSSYDAFVNEIIVLGK